MSHISHDDWLLIVVCRDLFMFQKYKNIFNGFDSGGCVVEFVLGIYICIFGYLLLTENVFYSMVNILHAFRRM